MRMGRHQTGWRAALKAASRVGPDPDAGNLGDAGSAERQLLRRIRDRQMSAVR
jgi:hypothetical protein